VVVVAIDPEDFTRAVHVGVRPDPKTGAIMTPIYQTSTFVQETPGNHRGWDYSRAGNPTRDALEEALAGLERARYGLAFASGLAAEQAIVQLLEPGDHVIVCDDVYGGTGRLFRRLYAKYDLRFDFIDLSDIKAVRAAIQAKTKMIWVETPTNPLLKIVDIEAVAGLARAAGARLVVDNTFASPIFQSPLALGADLVVHSTTKYIGGHSDLIGGAIMTSDQGLFDSLKFTQFAGGAVPGPHECFMLLRSIKTLAIRMEKHEVNAREVAAFLASHPRVTKTFYPGLPSHPQHALATKQMCGFSGMISFSLDGGYKEVLAFLGRLKIFALAESLGGVESLVNHPEKMTHASVPPDLRQKLGINESLIRLSVGIESASDLIADLKDALSAFD
jgi:cystathionine beta-lyase/cystathionine gamma-synthase